MALLVADMRRFPPLRYGISFLLGTPVKATDAILGSGQPVNTLTKCQRKRTSLRNGSQKHLPQNGREQQHLMHVRSNRHLKHVSSNRKKELSADPRSPRKRAQHQVVWVPAEAKAVSKCTT